jgi:hypothetical protein
MSHWDAFFPFEVPELLALVPVPLSESDEHAEKTRMAVAIPNPQIFFMVISFFRIILPNEIKLRNPGSQVSDEKKQTFCYS